MLSYHAPLGGNATVNLPHGMAAYAALGVPSKALVLVFAWFGQDWICADAAPSAACTAAYPHCWGTMHNYAMHVNES